MKKEGEEKEQEREEEKSSESREVQSHVEGTEVGSPRYLNQIYSVTEFEDSRDSH